MVIILMQENERWMRPPTGISKNIPAPISLPDALRNFHKQLTRAVDPLNDRLSISDALLSMVYAVLSLSRKP